MSYRIVCTVLLLTALASRHAAQESGAESGQGSGELQKGSPQYIYMQHLHSKLMAKKDRITASLESTDGGGTLLATSFESHKLSGTCRMTCARL